MGKNQPKWFDDFGEEPKGLSQVFNMPCDVTETPPEKLDANYYAVMLWTEHGLELVKVHELTVRDIIRFKKANPDKRFVMSYDEETRKVRVM